MRYTRFIAIILAAGAFMIGACAKKAGDSSSFGSSGVSRYLYVASGACYAGNNTSLTVASSSNVIYKVDMNSGQRVMTVADFSSFPANIGTDTPVAMADKDSNFLYVLVENTTAGLRRIEKVAKSDHGDRSILTNNTTVLAGVGRSLAAATNGDLLIDRTSAIEYVTSTNVRYGAPYVNPSVAPCASSNTNIVKFKLLSNNKVVFLHAAAGQNRIGIMNPTIATNTTCQGALSAPNANSYPSAMFYDADNHLLFVAYAGNATTTDLNSIYSYSIDETAGTITNAQKIYDAANFPATTNYLLYGISEMAYDSATATVYVATAISTATTVTNFAIEKFYYDPTKVGVDNTKVLTRSGNQSFYISGSDTKCISSMMVAN